MYGCDGAAFAACVRAGGIGCSTYASKGFAGARLNISAGSPVNLAGINIYLLSAAQQQKKGSIFARYRDADNIFWKVYGSTDIRTMLEKGVAPQTIIAGWSREAQSFRGARQGYLLY